MGNVVLFKDKEISSIFSHQLKDAIALLLQQLVVPKSRVLFAFSDGHHGQDLDPSNVLARKEVSVCYLSSKENLTKIESKLGKKVLT